MFKVGDKVICFDIISHTRTDNNTIKNLILNKTYTIRIFFDNDTRKITQYYTDLLFVEEIDNRCIYSSSRFMLLSEYNKKFKIGDKVVCIDNSGKTINSLKKGEIYTIFNYAPYIDKYDEIVENVHLYEQPGGRYYPDRFMKLSEYRKKKLLEIENVKGR